MSICRRGDRIADDHDRLDRIDARRPEPLRPTGGVIRVGVERLRPPGDIHPDGAGDLAFVEWIAAADFDDADGRVLCQLGGFDEK
jgi:hypothetical protein